MEAETGGDCGRNVSLPEVDVINPLEWVEIVKSKRQLKNLWSSCSKRHPWIRVEPRARLVIAYKD